MGTDANYLNKEEEFIGVIPRAINSIFDRIDKESSSVYLSFLEIYNEDLIDLFTDQSMEYKPEIQVRQDTKGNIICDNLTEIEVDSTDKVLSLLHSGSLRRQTGSTEMNKNSSRSHAIFTLKLIQKNNNTEENTKHYDKITIQSKFNFVDLAGSERIKKTGAVGNRAKEGININGGLLALGNVISVLAESHKKGHVPYRDSKLTRILQDSIGGNSYTLMIACVSPVLPDLNETLNTLKYATRARNIKNTITRNEEEEYDAERMKDIIESLKSEIHLLKNSNENAQNDVVNAQNIKMLYRRNVVLEKDLNMLKDSYKRLQQKYNSLVLLMTKKQSEDEKLKYNNVLDNTTDSERSVSSRLDTFPKRDDYYTENKELKDRILFLEAQINTQANTKAATTTKSLEPEFKYHEPSVVPVYKDNPKTLQKEFSDSNSDFINKKGSINNTPPLQFIEKPKFEKSHSEMVSVDLDDNKIGAKEYEQLKETNKKDKILIEKLQLEISELKSLHTDNEIVRLLEENESEIWNRLQLEQQDSSFEDGVNMNVNLRVITIKCLIKIHLKSKDLFSSLNKKTNEIAEFVAFDGLHESRKSIKPKVALSQDETLISVSDELKNVCMNITQNIEAIFERTKTTADLLKEANQLNTCLSKELSNIKEKFQNVETAIKALSDDTVLKNDSVNLQNKSDILDYIDEIKNNIREQSKEYINLVEDQKKVEKNYNLLENRLKEIKRKSDSSHGNETKSSTNKSKFLCF